jgi:hypothetical protein
MSKTRDHAAMEKRRQRAGKLFAKDCSVHLGSLSLEA